VRINGQDGRVQDERTHPHTPLVRRANVLTCPCVVLCRRTAYRPHRCDRRSRRAGRDDQGLVSSRRGVRRGPTQRFPAGCGLDAVRAWPRVAARSAGTHGGGVPADVDRLCQVASRAASHSSSTSRAHHQPRPLAHDSRDYRSSRRGHELGPVLQLR
jgi:hypothetical protein